MDKEKKLTLNYVKEMFNGTFDEDIIESVLEQRQWNTDRALDDLMVMAQGCTFEIPTEDFTETAPAQSNASSSNLISDFLSHNGIDGDNASDEKAESEDEIIVVDEEEFCLTGESESDDAKSTAQIPLVTEPASSPKPSYANIARKDPPVYQQVSQIKPPAILYQGYTSFERMKRTRDSVERVKLFVRERSKIMVLLRGVSGSGKSSLAKQIVTSCGLESKNPYWYIHSSDNYFHLNNLGTYQYDVSKLDEAHKWNQKNVLCVVHNGLTPVIIDNTHTKIWEMEAYARMAVCAGYEIEVIEPDTPWAFQIAQLFKKNIHGIAVERIRAQLQRYEYNVSSSLLLKTFHLEYTSDNIPPQTGTCELTDKPLVLLFEDLYNAIHVFPQQLKKLRRQQRPSRKARRKQRELEQRELDEIVQAIENCGVQNDADDSTQDEIDIEDEVVKSFVKNKLTTGNTETSDSDKSWEDISDDSYVSLEEDEDEESADNSSDESDNAENDSDECDSSVSSESSAEIPENDIDEGETAPVKPIDEESEPNGDLKSVNSMIDSFKNPVDLPEDELSVEINSANKNKFSNRLYDKLSKNTPRLKCFENFHGIDGMDDLDDDPISNVSDPELVQNANRLIEEDSEPKILLDDSAWKHVPDSSLDPTSIVKNILNNTWQPIEKSVSSDNSSDLLATPDIPSINTPPDENVATNITYETGFNEFEDRLCTVSSIVDSNRTSVESFHDAQESFNSSFAAPEVTVIYNEPDKLNETKSNKSLKNINAAASGNSTSSCAEDDRNSLLNEAKKLTSSVESDTSLSYRNNLNDGDASVTENYTDQVISSSKFKPIGDEMSSSNVFRNVIENDLWGSRFEENTNIIGTGRNQCPSENSEENSDYGSNSSSSDELRFTDRHNSATRFVNNDINRDVATGEKKKQNVALKNKNTTATVTDDDNDTHSTWNVDSTVELNTLKERILVNSLDKVFGQKAPLAGIEDQETEGDLQPATVSRKSSSCGAVFQLIENKLNDKSDKNLDRSTDDAAASTSRDDQETETSSFWNQWMKGDSWDTKETTEPKDSNKITEPKPSRSKNSSESPNKQKNTDITHSIRLVNDIKNADKNKILGQKLKNFEPVMTDYFKHRSYPNTEDSMFGLPAAYDGKFRNILHDSSKDTSYYGINTMLKKTNDNSDADEQIKSSYWSQTDDSSDNDSARGFKRDQVPKNDPSDPEQPKPIRRTPRKPEGKTSPGSVDELVRRWKSITTEETPPDYDKVFKWSPVKDVVDIVDWNTEDKFPAKISNCAKPQIVSTLSKVNYFLSEEIAYMKRDQGTNTGPDDVTDQDRYRVARCREININREHEIRAIDTRMRCDKSTMTEGSCYTVKVKPIKEDLSNMFPQEMADSILDLYEKCNGNMDWIIEILMEDGYSPTDDQLEYLSSLHNVVNYDVPMDLVIRDKPANEKRKNKSNGNGGKSNRRNNNGVEEKDPTDSPKKMKKKKADSRAEKQPINFGSEEYHTEEAPFSIAAHGEDTNEEGVDLFLDATMVQQLIGFFGNPTVYDLKDCQPVIKLPVSLARQIHACLFESVIDQAEKNEFLINQLAEEELITEDPQNIETSTEVTQNDMIEVENSLSDLINSQVMESTNNEDSFASKLSLDLLLKSFPTLDPTFVVSTFKSNNCNYYETKKVLSQMRPEVETNLAFNLNDNGRLVDRIRNNKDVPLFEPVTTSLARNEVLEQVNSYRDDAAFNYEQWQKFNEKLKTTLQRKRFGIAPYYRELMTAFKQKYDEANASAAATLINSCCKNSNVIDLHFFKVTEALRALDIFLDHHITRLITAGRPKTTLYIITGRGAGNSGGVSLLQPPIKSRLRKRNIEFEVQPFNTGLVVAVVRKSSPLTNDL